MFHVDALIDILFSFLCSLLLLSHRTDDFLKIFLFKLFRWHEPLESLFIEIVNLLSTFLFLLRSHILLLFPFSFLLNIFHEILFKVVFKQLLIFLQFFLLIFMKWECSTSLLLKLFKMISFTLCYLWFNFL